MLAAAHLRHGGDMRSMGLVLLGLGLFGFIYCGDQVARHPAPAEASTMSIQESLQNEGVRWEMARWAAALGGAVGLLFLFVPSRS
jgi:hypothetical protein